MSPIGEFLVFLVYTNIYYLYISIDYLKLEIYLAIYFYDIENLPSQIQFRLTIIVPLNLTKSYLNGEIKVGNSQKCKCRI